MSSQLRKIAALQLKLNKLTSGMPRVVGQLAVNFFKDNFRRQAFSGERPWPARKEPSYPLAKFGRKQKKKRALLVKSGALRRSIRVIDLGANYVVVGTTLPYAALHNQGGVVNQTILPTAKMKKWFWANHYAAKKAGDEKAAEAWKRRALSSKPLRRTIKIPQRKFIGHSPRLNAMIVNHMAKSIKKSMQ